MSSARRRPIPSALARPRGCPRSRDRIMAQLDLDPLRRSLRTDSCSSARCRPLCRGRSVGTASGPFTRIRQARSRVPRRARPIPPLALGPGGRLPSFGHRRARRIGRLRRARRPDAARQHPVYATGHVALETPHHLALRQPLFGAPLDVASCSRIRAQRNAPVSSARRRPPSPHAFARPRGHPRSRDRIMAQLDLDPAPKESPDRLMQLCTLPARLVTERLKLHTFCRLALRRFLHTFVARNCSRRASGGGPRGGCP